MAMLSECSDSVSLQLLWSVCQARMLPAYQKQNLCRSAMVVHFSVTDRGRVCSCM